MVEKEKCAATGLPIDTLLSYCRQLQCRVEEEFLQGRWFEKTLERELYWPLYRRVFSVSKRDVLLPVLPLQDLAVGEQLSVNASGSGSTTSGLSTHANGRAVRLTDGLLMVNPETAHTHRVSKVLFPLEITLIRRPNKQGPLNKLAYDVARFDEHDHYHGPKNCKGYRQDFGSLLGGGLLLFFSHVPVTTVAGDRPALDWFAKRLREYRDNGIALMLLGWYWDGATLTRLLEPDDDLGVRWSGLLDGSPVGSSVDGAPLF